MQLRQMQLLQWDPLHAQLPALATDNTAGNSNVHIVDGTAEFDHVFMMEHSTPSEASHGGYSIYAPFLALVLAILA